MIDIMKNIFLTLFTIVSFSITNAQGFGYDSKIDLGNGLYKVKSGGYYGVVDNNDDVVVSIEYQDIIFREGNALLTRKDVLLGVIDTLGKVKMFSGIYKIHPYYRYVYDGYILVSLVDETIYPDRWGYVDVNEKPLRMQQKVKGTLSYLPNKPTMFDDIRPFVNGCAAVFLKKYGWKHIDKYGREHFALNDVNNNALFRSSLHDGECIIVTTDGIKLYQESKDYKAVVKRILSAEVTNPNFNYTDWTCVEGLISLDSLMRAYKYENQTDSIVFFEDPKDINVLSLKEDIKVELIYRNIQANENGKAYTEIKLVNTSDKKIKLLEVVLKCDGANKSWKGELEANSNIKIPFNVPARFSESNLKKNIVVKVNYKNDSVEYDLSVNIKRYNPTRSR